MKVADLRETRANKISEMRALIAGAESAGRDLSAEESSRFDALKSEAENLEQRLARAEFLAEAERRAAGSPVNGEMARESRSYRLAKAVNEFAAGKLTGREAEIQQELSRGRESRGLSVPSEILLGGAVERRDGQTVADSTAGGFMVQTALGAMQDRFRPAMKVEAMGATILRNLNGPIDLPNLSASGSAYWVAEGVNTTRTASTFEKVSMNAKTASAEYKISRRLLLQSSESIEGILRNDLGQLLAGAIDKAAINGVGTTDPLGIINTVGITTITTTQDVMAHASALIAALDDADCPAASRGFLGNSKVAKSARDLKDGQGLPYGLPTIFSGLPFSVSNNIPTTLGVGGNKSGLIFGEWSQLFVGYWSAIDIVPNIYHSDVASAGGMLLHAFVDCDVAVRNEKAFAVSLM